MEIHFEKRVLPVCMDLCFSEVFMFFRKHIFYITHEVNNIKTLDPTLAFRCEKEMKSHLLSFFVIQILPLRQSLGRKGPTYSTLSY